ncbi:MAG: hypothetical protein ACM30E_06970 [Nitrososphaerales archaeon]
MTVLEAHVAQEQWSALVAAYEAGNKNLPSPMVQTLLVQDTADRTLWRGISIWHSREALQEYRGSVETPGGVLMFRSAGAEPSLAIFEVASHAERGAAQAS